MRPRRIEGLAPYFIVQVRCGARHGVALTASGDIFTWGEGFSGQLGNGTFIRSLKPVHVADLAGYPIRKSETILVVLLALHRDPKLWGDDVERFDPDRFLPAAVRARPAHAYKPFGVGARACIGRQFALHEAVLALARILTHFDIAPVPGYELKVEELLTIRPKNLRLVMRPRKR